MKVSKNSWHYKLLAYFNVMKCQYKYFGDKIRQFRKDGMSYVEIYDYLTDYHPSSVNRPMTFCQYWRDILIYGPITFVINAAFMATVFTLLAILLTSIPLIGYVSITAVLVGIVFFIVGMVLLVDYTPKLVSRVSGKLVNSDSFFNKIYESKKNNVCSIMEYEDEKRD